MDAELRNLMMRWEGAANCLVLLEQCGASNAAIDLQRERVRMLRLEMERLTPDGYHDPFADNVVAHIA